MAFRIGAEDARMVAHELGIASEQVLTDTANFSAWVKLMRDGVPTDVRSVDTLPPDPSSLGQLVRVRNRTRARYARPRPAVEEKIARFLSS